MGSLPLALTLLALFQEENQGQREEEEREAETHRMSPVSTGSVGGGGLGELGQRVVSGWVCGEGREKQGQDNLGVPNRMPCLIGIPRLSQNEETLVLVLALPRISRWKLEHARAQRLPLRASDSLSMQVRRPDHHPTPLASAPHPNFF